MPPTHEEITHEWIRNAALRGVEELPPIEAAPDRSAWAALRLIEHYGWCNDPVLTEVTAYELVEVVRAAYDEFEGREPALIALAQRCDMLLDGLVDPVEVEGTTMYVVPGFLIDMVRDTRRGIDLGPEYGGTGHPATMAALPEDRDG